MPWDRSPEVSICMPRSQQDKLASQLNRSVDGVPYQVDALHEEEILVQLVVDRQASLCACSPGPS